MSYLHLLGEHAVREPEVGPEVGVVHDALFPRRERVRGQPSERETWNVLEVQVAESFLGEDRCHGLVINSLEQDSRREDSPVREKVYALLFCYPAQGCDPLHDIHSDVAER